MLGNSIKQYYHTWLDSNAKMWPGYVLQGDASNYYCHKTILAKLLKENAPKMVKWNSSEQGIIRNMA